ncbi:IS1595 family transposase, partial [Glaesserella parasuis]|nr:IS1595 family transposase [Glaesserella parasuis]
VYTDFYRSYDVLDVSEFNHFRINHSNLKSQISILKQLVKGSLS